MKVGDLVRWHTGSRFAGVTDDIMGIVVQMETPGRQTISTVLFAEGLSSRIWINHLEVVDESR